MQNSECMTRKVALQTHTHIDKRAVAFRMTTIAMALVFTACGDSTTPVDTTYANPAGTSTATAVAIIGSGEGGVSVTPKSGSGNFVADIKVRVRKGMPNTTYIIQRAPEIGRPNSSNGICERGLALAPWSSADAPAASFLTFSAAPTGSAITLVTNGAGDGSADFQFAASTIPTGTVFDVMFRLINDAAAPTAVILSRCFTVTVL